jgi:zinc transport system substrate-binding protein
MMSVVNSKSSRSLKERCKALSSPVLAGLAWLWSMCTVAGAPEPMAVFVSILPQKYFVEQVGGHHVQVSVMVGSGQSPATYDPTPRQLLALGEARAYFRIGVPFETAWMGRIATVNPRMVIIDTRRGIQLRAMERSLGWGGGRHSKGLQDPHIWTSPPLVEIQARNIRDALTDLDPAHKADYERNWQRFAAELKALDAYIRERLRDLKDRNVMVFHPSWGYFAHAYGLHQIPIETEGKAPGARDLARLIEQARTMHIRVIFMQTQYSRRTAQAIADAIGARVVAVDPLAEDYVQNLKHVTDAFAEAMSGS